MSLPLFPPTLIRDRLMLLMGQTLATAALMFGVMGHVSALASSADEAVPPNPLESTEPDPLLPEMVITRPLSPQERDVLAAALDELQAQAQTKLQQGDGPGAFEIWNRELRLRRYLGAAAEVESLGRVGEVAWRESQTTEVRVITQRLQDIEQETSAQSPVNEGLLFKIGAAYQQVRSRQPAIALYSKLLDQAKQEQNVRRQRQTLEALGTLHLAWFDYANAADAYRQLVELAKTQGDRASELDYLQTLASVYQQNRQPEQAIAAQKRLVDIYQTKQDLKPIPALKLAMGDEYITLNRPDLAAPSYQEAFAVARSTQQYGYAHDALQRLGALYRGLNRWDDVLVVYQLLLDVQRQSYDTLGMMNTYDQIGQVQRAQGHSDQALATFRQGLELAKQLNYKVSYFNQQIEAIAPTSTP